MRIRNVCMLFFVLGYLGFSTSSAAVTPSLIRIGTAHTTGSWYPMGIAVADVLNSKGIGTKLKVEVTGGGEQNVLLLAEKAVEAALVPSWTVVEADQRQL